MTITSVLVFVICSLLAIKSCTGQGYSDLPWSKDPLFFNVPTPDVVLSGVTLKASDGKGFYSLSDRQALEALKKNLRLSRYENSKTQGKRVGIRCEFAFEGRGHQTHEAGLEFFKDRVCLWVGYDGGGFLGSASYSWLDDSLTPKMMSELRAAFHVDGDSLPNWESMEKR